MRTTVTLDEDAEQLLVTGGNLVNDAHLAALAVEHRVKVVSFGNDFSRSSGVDWEQPRSDPTQLGVSCNRLTALELVSCGW